MSLELILISFGLLLTLFTHAIYISARFAKLESEVNQHARDNEEFREIREIVYKMSAKMDLILNKTVEKKLLI